MIVEDLDLAEVYPWYAIEQESEGHTFNAECCADCQQFNKELVRWDYP